MARCCIEVFALHVQHHGTALIGQKVRNDEPRGLTAPGWGHDQGMGEDLGHDKGLSTLGLAHFAEDKAVTGLSEKAVPLHLGHLLPVGFPKFGQRIVLQHRTEQNTGTSADPQDQVNDLHIAGVGRSKYPIAARQHQEIDIRSAAEPTKRHKGRRQNIPQHRAEKRKAHDAECDPRLPLSGVGDVNTYALWRPLRRQLKVHRDFFRSIRSPVSSSHRPS